MPAEGVDLSPPEHLLSSEEIQRVAAQFVALGVDKIRLTGGEPLVRKDIVDIVRGIGALRGAGLKDLCITTNGIALHRKLDDLTDAGVNLINLSLDTLDPHKFKLITRRNGFEHVLRAIESASGHSRVERLKVNCVVIRGVNDGEILDFVRLAQQKNVEVRFIEYMPFDGNRWESRKMVSYMEILDIISKEYPSISRVDETEYGATAKRYTIPGLGGSIGFISSMSNHFCGSCNRLRVTADGNLKVCLFGSTEVNLRDMLRKGEGLEEVIASAVSRKKEKHAGMTELHKQSGNNRPMIKIGDTAFSHVDAENQPTMVDVSHKAISSRTAEAEAVVYLPSEVWKASKSKSGNDLVVSSKGPVSTTAIIAGTQAVKRTADLIPFCHPLPIESIKLDIQFFPQELKAVVRCKVKVDWKTGVEMEALTGASVAALCIYDMCKAVSHNIEIKSVRLVSKSGGKRDFNSV